MNKALIILFRLFVVLCVLAAFSLLTSGIQFGLYNTVKPLEDYWLLFGVTYATVTMISAVAMGVVWFLKK
uniref:Uncharacterized protein n=1 Tax=viral metagenome TaxID=1070528 RepID=A0A6C0IUS2_9ZZZZ